MISGQFMPANQAPRRESVDSILARDFPTLQGAVLVSVLFYLAMSILIDVLYGILDPRIRLDGARA